MYWNNYFNIFELVTVAACVRVIFYQCTISAIFRANEYFLTGELVADFFCIFAGHLLLAPCAAGFLGHVHGYEFAAVYRQFRHVTSGPSVLVLSAAGKIQSIVFWPRVPGLI